MTEDLRVEIFVSNNKTRAKEFSCNVSSSNVHKSVALNLVVIFPRGKRPPYSPYFGIVARRMPAYQGAESRSFIRRS